MPAGPILTSKDHEELMRRRHRVGSASAIAAGVFMLLLILGGGWPPRIQALVGSMGLWLIVLSLYAFLRMRRQAGVAIRQLRRMAIIDEDSQSFDVPYLRTRLDEEYERANRYGGVTALLCVDVGNLDGLGERFGRQARDEVLEKVSGVMAGVLRQCDVLGRLRRYEFLAIMPETNRRKSRNAIDRLRQAVESWCSELPDDQAAFVKLSIGIAAYPLNGKTMENVLSAATKAMEDARSKGGDGFSVSGDFIRSDEAGRQFVAQVRGEED